MFKKNFVKFMSAGTFCSEDTIKEIDEWNVDKAIEMSKTILERHNSRPYAFQFITKGREDDELDSRVINRSGMYYLNGIVRTLEEVKLENNPNDNILISNMECNGWKKVVTTCNPYKWTQPLYENDVVLSLE